MAPQVVHLPDGQTFTVTPVFAGVAFKSHELTTHHNAFPIGWTTVLHTEEVVQPVEQAHTPSEHATAKDDEVELKPDELKPAELKPAELKPLEVRPDANGAHISSGTTNGLSRPKIRIHPFTKPTLQNDTLFLSSISSPASSEFKPAASPTRQIAMMMWITMYWYFHQPEPSPALHTAASSATPQGARPNGEWRINIKRDGVLRGRNLIPKLERMGLLACDDTAVGTSLDDSGDGWDNMFVTKRMFWQIPGQLFLFTLAPNRVFSSFPGSPAGSRSTSPVRGESPHSHFRQLNSPSPMGQSRVDSDLPGAPMPTTLVTSPSFPIGPFFSTSHLPTYYPPPPLQYTFTSGIRHPLRPKPPRMGEVFYTRYVPSVEQYLSFRVASSSTKPVPYLGPIGHQPPQQPHLTAMSDASLLETWHANPRVNEFWGNYDAQSLNTALNTKHSFPVIGLWDGVPFGYFEIYWVKEDILGQNVGHEANDWDRGLHIMIGEEWSRGRVATWLTGLIHWSLNADFRTMSVCLEPRVDNTRIMKHLEAQGFSKERQVSFPHKQAWFVRLRRDQWNGPAL